MTEKDLKRFIIKGFVSTAILVAVVEFIILFVIINVLIPILIDEFFPYIYDITSFKELWDLPASTKWVLLMMMLGTFIISVLPLTAGAGIFSGRVTRKFKVYEAEREIERASVQKQRYLMISDIAHDLKTPMTTVSGYAKALADGMVREDQETEYLEAIRDKTLRMNDIVQMLFDYVRLDSEGFTIAKKRTDICELVRECVASHYSDIETSGDEAEIDIQDEVMEADVDKIQLSRVINNLLTNAVKHNPKGTTIGVFVRGEPDEIRVFIADSGDAIDEELAQELFEPFVMGDKSRSTAGGSGLGLSVAHKIADLHGAVLKLVQSPEMKRYQLGEKYSKVFLLILKRAED